MKTVNTRTARRAGRASRAGFTLMEVLLVLVILVIIGSLAGVAIRSAQQRGYENAARAQIGLFKTPLETYQLDMGNYPSSSQQLEALVQPPSDATNSAKWSGPYMDVTNVPLDPWDRPYGYAFPGKVNVNSYDVWSFGPDGVDNSGDEIGNWPET